MSNIIIGYFWLFIHRPFEIWPTLATLRIELIYFLVMLSTWLFAKKVNGQVSWLSIAYLVFACSVLSSWLISPWSETEKSRGYVQNYFKIIAIYPILVTSIRSRQELQKIVVSLIVIMSVYMLHSLREYKAGRSEYRMGINRMIGVDTFLGDPNSFSASIVYMLPLTLPCWSLTKTRWERIALACYILLSVLCIILTGSRGAFLGLIFLAISTLLWTRSRLRTLLISVILVPAIWLIMPLELRNRFTTIIDPSVGPANAQVSAKSRTEGLYLGLGLWSRYPVTGCGPGAWIPATGSAVESHNLFGEVPGELGSLGVLSFMAVVGLLYYNVFRITKLTRNSYYESDLFYKRLAHSIGLAVTVMLLMGYGAHNLYRFSWVWYGALLVVARRTLTDEVDSRSKNEME